MKHLVIFNTDGCFYGEISPIKDIRTLYNAVYDKVYLLGHLEDEAGNLRPLSDFSESDLISILKKVSWASDLHLVNSLSEVGPLSTHPRYSLLSKSYINNQSQPT